jgi:hypothetical protein
MSIIAISSATRTGGLYSATELPSTTIAARLVRLASTEAIRLGEGMRPYPLLWCSLTQIASKPHSSAYTSWSR